MGTWYQAYIKQPYLDWSAYSANVAVYALTNARMYLVTTYADADVASRVEDFLQQRGWQLDGAIEWDGSNGWVTVAPVNWCRIVEDITRTRVDAYAEFARVHSSWARVIASAMRDDTAGCSRVDLARAAGVTPGRLYQLRDQAEAQAEGDS